MSGRKKKINSGTSTSATMESLLDITNPESEGLILNQLVSLAALVKTQSEAIETLKGLPEVVQEMKDRLEEFEKFELDIPVDAPSVNLPSDVDLFENVIRPNSEEILDKEEHEVSDLLKLLSDKEDTMEYGPPVLEAVASGMLKSVSRPLTKETEVQLKSNVSLPENCKSLGVPKVNPEIWNSLPNKARLTDLRLQQMQQSVSFGLTTFANIADLLGKSQSSSELHIGIMQQVKNGSNLLGNGFQEINLRRRYEIKQHITSEYAGICTMKEPATEYLFGDNLEDQLKKSKSTSDLVRKFSSRTAVPRFRPYNRSQYQQGSLNFQRPSPEYLKRGGLQRGQYSRGWRNQRRQSSFRPPRNY